VLTLDRLCDARSVACRGQTPVRLAGSEQLAKPDNCPVEPIPPGYTGYQNEEEHVPKPILRQPKRASPSAIAARVFEMLHRLPPISRISRVPAPFCRSLENHEKTCLAANADYTLMTMASSKTGPLVVVRTRCVSCLRHSGGSRTSADRAEGSCDAQAASSVTSGSAGRIRLTLGFPGSMPRVSFRELPAQIRPPWAQPSVRRATTNGSRSGSRR